MITTKEIAELAGVSRGTVDRVLHNRGHVNESTKVRIHEIVKRLDYKPNLAGRSLVNKQKNWKVGCIIVKANNPFYDDLCMGLEERISQYETYGLQTVLMHVPFEAAAQCEAIDGFVAQGINALIIQPVDEISVRYKLMELMSKNILVVTVNTTLPDFSPFCYIGNDFYVCGKIAANLLELVTGGACKIGIVTGNFNAQSHYSRIRGFQEYSKNYPQMEIVEIIENKDDEFISFERTKQMLLDHPEIDALFLVAGGVNGACRALKTFPNHQKVRVVSFDTVPTTKELVKDETIFATISQQPREQGMLALKVLFNKFFNNEDPSGDKLYTHIEIKLKTNIDL